MYFDWKTNLWSTLSSILNIKCEKCIFQGTKYIKIKEIWKTRTIFYKKKIENAGAHARGEASSRRRSIGSRVRRRASWPWSSEKNGEYF